MIRVVFVTVMTLWALAGILPDFSLTWHPYSVTGIAINGDFTITGVRPNSAAARAGIVPGDRLNLRETPPESRPYSSSIPLRAGKKVTIAVDRDGVTHKFTLTAQRRERSLADNISLVLRLLSALLFVGMGTIIVLLRPTPMTWALYLFSVGTTGTDQVSQMILPLPLLMIDDFLVGVASVVGWGSFFIFALRFPNDEVRGARRTLDRLAWYVIGVLVVSRIYFDFGYFFGAGSDLLQRLNAIILGVIYASGLLAFVHTYLHSLGPVRKRVEWIMVGFALGLGASTLVNVLQTFLPGLILPIWFGNFAAAINLVVPLTLGYAVIRHRVIDVSFIANRALVYGIMTSLLVAVFALLDWFFSKELVNGKLGTLAEVLTAVALGFWLNSMHKRVDYIVDTVFFRERHRVERHLSRVASALSSAVSRRAVAESIVDEPCEALGLASAALFNRSDEGLFALQRAIGWDDSAVATLPADDLLAMQLSAEQGPLSLHEVPWRIAGLPGGAAHPTLAVPIVVRFQLWGIALYGAHTHGEDMDPDEVAILRSLGIAAAAAFDHLQAEELRAQIDVLSRQVSSLGAAGAS